MRLSTYIGGVIVLCLSWSVALAAIVPSDTPDQQLVLDVTERGWYFGTLTGAPQMFLLYIEEPTDVFLEVVVPSRGGDDLKDHAGIVVRRAERGVDEVARLEAKNAPWERFFDLPTGSFYHRGASFRGQLPHGEYFIEVHSPDNLGPYALRFGDAGSLAGVGYLGKLRDLYTIKAMQGALPLGLLSSPYVFVPILLVAWYLGYRRRRYA
jgi:hypothetical protein